MPDLNIKDGNFNPTDLGILEREIKRVKRGRYVLMKAIGMGHQTAHVPRAWKRYVKEMLAEDPRRRRKKA